MILVLVMIILSSIIYAANPNQCDVAQVKVALKKALYQYYRDPSSSQITVDKMRDLLSFYLSIPTNEQYADCNLKGAESNKKFQQIIDEINAILNTLPKCKDGTVYGECSSTLPLYCFNGNLVNKCSLCGCADEKTCQTDGNCVSTAAPPPTPSPPSENTTNGTITPPPINGICGDAICNSAETCSSCEKDCGKCAEQCSDQKCTTSETCTTCAGDCGSCTGIPSTKPFYTKEVTFAKSTSTRDACVAPSFGVQAGTVGTPYGSIDRATNVYTDSGNRPGSPQPLAVRFSCATGTGQQLTLTTDKGPLVVYLGDTDDLAETYCIAEDGSSYSADAQKGKGANDNVPDMDCIQAMSSTKFTAAPLMYCGDSKCNGVETCTSCERDCGICATFQCSDDKDNDADGKIDYLNDLGCTSLTDNDEFNLLCGDKICSGNETCTSCSLDCGSCFNYTITEQQITSNGGPDYYPVMYEEKVVYFSKKDGNYDIYLYDLSSNKEIRITNTPEYQSYPDIYGDKIVWADRRHSVVPTTDVYLYDLSTMTERRITAYGAIVEPIELNPRIYKDNIVFVNRKDNLSEFDIYLYDLNMNELKQITTNSAKQKAPAIYENKIVWEDNRSGNWDIYLYDLSTGQEKQIPHDSTDQKAPNIYENKIVWLDYANYYHPDIYIYDLLTNQQKKIITDVSGYNTYTPPIYGNKVGFVRTSVSSPSNMDVYIHDLATDQEVKITQNAEGSINQHKIHPDIYGDKVVWGDFRIYGNWDIYMATIS